MFRKPLVLLALTAVSPSMVQAAQVDVRPASLIPGARETVSVSVANARMDAIVSVKVAVPGVVAIVGAENKPGWTASIVRGTDSTSHEVSWSGGRVERDEFVEFRFLTRLSGDADQGTLFFPILVTRSDSTTEGWEVGSTPSAPSVRIVGAMSLTPRGTWGIAAVAVGIATAAMGLAITAHFRR